ncbi:hypothetical protein ACU4HD_26645 [Cupriavidus basilensis]
MLEEGVACRPGDIDMVWTAGYGFPDYLGGPVWQADSIGLPRIVAGLEHYARLRGNPYDYWDISPLLAALARGGQRLSGWSAPPAAADTPATAEQGRPAMPISLSPDPLAGQSRIQSGSKPPQSVH